MTRAELDGLRHLKKKIEMQSEWIAELESRATRSTTDLTEPAVQVGSQHSAVESAAVQVVTAREKLEELKTERSRAEMQLLSELPKIENARARRIILYRYADGLDWYAVARQEHCSSRRALQLHQLGLARLLK